MEKIVSDWYESNYSKVNLTGNSDSFAARKIHRLIESGRQGVQYSKCLEIGTNNSSHLPFVKHPWSEYTLLDLRPEAGTQSDPYMTLSGVRFIQADVHSLPFEDDSVDRVISTCLFHHLEDPLQAMKELIRVVRPGGVIDIFLPSDPGLSYRVVRFLTTSLKARKHGVLLELKYFNAIEHRNHIKSLIVMAQYVFESQNINLDWFPIPANTWNLNLACVLRVNNVKKMGR